MARSSVRSRTLAHLEKLVAIGVVSAACTGGPGYGVVDPIPPPATGDPSDGEKGNVPPPVEPKPVPPDPVYAVVDPIPAPASCESLSTALMASGSGEDGNLHVILRPGWRYEAQVMLDTVKTVRVKGATVVRETRNPNSWDIVLAPKGTEVTVTVPGTCGGKPEEARVKLSWSGTLGPDTPVAAVLTAAGKEAP